MASASRGVASLQSNINHRHGVRAGTQSTGERIGSVIMRYRYQVVTRKFDAYRIIDKISLGMECRGHRPYCGGAR